LLIKTFNIRITVVEKEAIDTWTSYAMPWKSIIGFTTFYKRFSEKGLNTELSIIKKVVQNILNNTYKEYRYNTNQLDILNSSQKEIWMENDETSVELEIKGDTAVIFLQIKEILITMATHGDAPEESHIKDPFIKDRLAQMLFNPEENIGHLKETINNLGCLLGNKNLGIEELQESTPYFQDIKDRKETSVIITKLRTISDFLTLATLSQDDIARGKITTKQDNSEIKMDTFIKNLKNRLKQQGEEAAIIDVDNIWNLIKPREGYTTKGNFTVEDTDDPTILVQIGEKPVASCQGYNYPNINFARCLPGYLADSNKKVVIVKRNVKRNDDPIARAIVRVMRTEDNTPVIFLEKIYSSVPGQTFKKEIITHLLNKARRMDVRLTTTLDIEEIEGLSTQPIGRLFSTGTRNSKEYSDSKEGKQSGIWSISKAKEIVADSDSGGPAARESGQGLTSEQHEVLNQAISEHFNGSILIEGKDTKLELDNIAYKSPDPEGILQKEGITIYILNGLNTRISNIAKSKGIEVPDDLLSHPGRARGNIYIDSEIYNKIKDKGSLWLAIWARHELTHIQNPNLSEGEIQKIAPMPPELANSSSFNEMLSLLSSMVSIGIDFKKIYQNPETYGKYGDLVIYYLISDIQKYGYSGAISPQTFADKINSLLGEDAFNIFKRQSLPVEQFFLIKAFFTTKLNNESLQEYGDESGIAKMIEEIETNIDYEGLKNINIAQLTGSINTQKKMAWLLGVSVDHPQLANWKAPLIQLTWIHYKGIQRIFHEKLEQNILKQYGDKYGFGLGTLLLEIITGQENKHEDNNPYKTLGKINIGYLSGLTNSKKKLAGFLNISVEHEQLIGWNMPQIIMTWNQLIAVQKELGTMLINHENNGVKLLVGIARDPSKLGGISLSNFVKFLNLKGLVAAILKIPLIDERLANLNVPVTSLTWEQLIVIQEGLSKMLTTEAFVKYGGNGVRILNDIINDSSTDLKAIKDIPLSELTKFLKPKNVVAALLQIDINDPRLANYNMPIPNKMTWEHLENIQKGLTKYGGDGVRLLNDIVNNSSNDLKAIKDIPLSELTKFLNPKSVAAALLRIDINDPCLANYNVPIFNNMTWKHLIAIQERLRTMLTTTGFEIDGVKLLDNIMDDNNLKDIPLSELTEFLNPKSIVAAFLGTDINDPRLFNWNIPVININMTTEELMRLKEPIINCGGDEIILLYSLANDEVLKKNITLHNVTSFLKLKSLAATLLRININDMPSVNILNMTWEQLMAIQDRLVTMLTATDFENDGIRILCRIMDSIDINKENGQDDPLDRLNLGELTKFLNPKSVVAALLRIDINDPRLASYKMLIFNITWDHLRAARKIFIDKLITGDLLGDDENGTAWLIKLLNEIEEKAEINNGNDNPHKTLKGINLGSFTKLIHSKERLAALLGISIDDSRLGNLDIPVISMSWDRFMAIRKILTEKFEAGTLVKDYGSNSEKYEGLCQLINDIEHKNGAYVKLRGINIYQLTAVLAKSKLAGILKIDEDDPRISGWNSPPTIDRTYNEFMDEYGLRDTKNVLPQTDIESKQQKDEAFSDSRNNEVIQAEVTTKIKLANDQQSGTSQDLNNFTGETIPFTITEANTEYFPKFQLEMEGLLEANPHKELINAIVGLFKDALPSLDTFFTLPLIKDPDQFYSTVPEFIALFNKISDNSNKAILILHELIDRLLRN
ncbi:MAG: hypothetical protein V1872_01320, partial [bacterium]